MFLLHAALKQNDNTRKLMATGKIVIVVIIIASLLLSIIVIENLD